MDDVKTGTETADRWLYLFMAALMGFFLGFAAGCLWNSGDDASFDKEFRPAFANAAAKQDFRRLLKKHGLNHDVSIIYEDHLGRYFVRDGQRCAFK